MMFKNFGLMEEGKAMRAAVNKSLEQGIATEDLVQKGTQSYDTQEFGDWP
jgi:3-isopropylmalate dehydrogenase